MKKKVIILSILIAVVLIGGIIIGYQKYTSSITLEEAKSIALKEVNGGEVVSTSQETDDGRNSFEIDVLDKNTLHKIEISASGRIKSHEQDTNVMDYGTTDNSTTNSGTTNSSEAASSANTTTQPSSKTITAEEASKIALNRVGGGTVVKNEFDTEDGVARYEIDITFGHIEYEVVINATSGAILYFEKDIN